MLWIIAAGWFLLVSTSFVPNLLVRWLEGRYVPLTKPLNVVGQDTVNIIVLGGGHTSDMRLPANNQLSSGALGRLCEGIRIHRLCRGGRLVLSGWGDEDTQSQARVLYNTALLLGVAAEEMDTLSKSRRTEEEAAYYMEGFGSKRKVIVVTDAVHMPRAMMLFKAKGLNVIAAPTNHIFKKGPWHFRISNYFPSGENIRKMEMGVHEVVGRVMSYEL